MATNNIYKGLIALEFSAHISVICQLISMSIGLK